MEFPFTQRESKLLRLILDPGAAFGEVSLPQSNWLTVFVPETSVSSKSNAPLGGPLTPVQTPIQSGTRAPTTVYARCLSGNIKASSSPKSRPLIWRGCGTRSGPIPPQPPQCRVGWEH
jgi:hypothetical protein